jgi:predicted nucleic acid-binding protein
MRFLDANVFIYAFYKPKKHLSEKEHQMKEQAKKIIANIFEGKEEALITVVHLSEVANILKHGLPQEQLTTIMRGLFMLNNLKIVGVSSEQYFVAVELGEDLKLEANDALAVDVMQQNGVQELYSFDEHFAHVEGVTKLP